MQSCSRFVGAKEPDRPGTNPPRSSRSQMARPARRRATDARIDYERARSCEGVPGCVTRALSRCRDRGAAGVRGLVTFSERATGYRPGGGPMASRRQGAGVRRMVLR